MSGSSDEENFPQAVALPRPPHPYSGAGPCSTPVVSTELFVMDGTDRHSRRSAACSFLLLGPAPASWPCVPAHNRPIARARTTRLSRLAWKGKATSSSNRTDDTTGYLGQAVVALIGSSCTDLMRRACKNIRCWQFGFTGCPRGHAPTGL